MHHGLNEPGKCADQHVCGQSSELVITLANQGEPEGTALEQIGFREDPRSFRVNQEMS
jgi:hypothetical protein